MKLSKKSALYDRVVEDLLNALEIRAAVPSVNAKELIRLAKYALQLIEQRTDVLIEVAATEQQERSDEPV